MTEETYWAPMGRCDQCGQFTKRGLFNVGGHLMVCKGKPKPVKPLPMGYRQPMFVGPETRKAIDEAFEHYWDAIR